MFDVCPDCGDFRSDKPVDQAASTLVCPCGHAEPFSRVPLLVVSGAAAAGKSTVLRELRGTIDNAVLLDSDVLWREEFRDSSGAYFETWLRLCRDIAQSGRSPMLFGTGFGVPDNLRQCPQYECFSAVRYLVLVCDDDVQRERLQARPAWRRSSESEMAEQIEFNQWLKTTAEEDEDFTQLDTTSATVDTTAQHVRDWIKATLD